MNYKALCDNNPHKSQKHKHQQSIEKKQQKPKHLLLSMGNLSWSESETPNLGEPVSVVLGCLSELEDKILFLKTAHILDAQLGSCQL